MFIMTVCINGCIEDPRLFKTHQSASDAMFEILKNYAKQCCSYSDDAVWKELVSDKVLIDRGFEKIDVMVDGWIEIYLTQYGASICFPHAKPYEGYDGCEVNITNMDEIEVEE